MEQHHIEALGAVTVDPVAEMGGCKVGQVSCKPRRGVEVGEMSPWQAPALLVGAETLDAGVEEATSDSAVPMRFVDVHLA